MEESREENQAVAGLRDGKEVRFWARFSLKRCLPPFWCGKSAISRHWGQQCFLVLGKHQVGGMFPLKTDPCVLLSPAQAEAKPITWLAFTT